MPYFKLFLSKLGISLLGITAFILAAIAVSYNPEIKPILAQGSDITPPTTSYILNPSSPDGNNDWYVSPVQVQLNATDLESGVKSINYRIDGGSWQNVNFSGTTNLIPNPSFETSSGSTSTGIAQWQATIIDPEASYAKDNTQYAPGYQTASARIVATGGAWHGVNHQNNFASVLPFDSLTASVWMKTQNVTGSALFRVYAVIPDGSGGYTYSQIAQTSGISGTNDWTLATLDFTVNLSNAVGVYLDIGLAGPGTVWIDAATLSTSLQNTSTNFTVATDSEDHTIEFYSVDFSDNTEFSSCSSPKSNCIEFKLDQTPPGNWNGSGAIRQIGGGSSSEHELWVFTNVEDLTSGLSTNSDRFQYFTSTQTDFGYYSDLLGCNSTWNSGQWVSLGESVTTDGDNEAYLETQKTDFCDSNWKECKDVRFYAEDMAGNIKTKDLCLNGPWVKVRGEGFVRSNAYIDMVAESSEPNSDSLIEVGGISIDFFTSSKDWRVFDAPIVQLNEYEDLYNQVTGTKTSISTSADLVTTSGVYEINGNYEIDNQSTPNNYDTAVFDQIVFVDGDLTISNDILIDEDSTALFIVEGHVYIDESVEEVGIALIVNEDIHTAYDLGIGDASKTLNLYGVYIADEIKLQRTLQGTQNNDTPSESFIFEPKYIIQLRQFFEDSTIQWVNRL